MSLHLGLVQEVLLEQTVQKGCTVTGVNLNEIKKQIAIWIDPDPRSVPLISTPYPRKTHSYRPVLISLRLIQVVILIFGVQDLLFRILMVVRILNLISMRLNPNR